MFDYLAHYRKLLGFDKNTREVLDTLCLACMDGALSGNDIRELKNEAESKIEFYGSGSNTQEEKPKYDKLEIKTDIAALITMDIDSDVTTDYTDDLVIACTGNVMLTADGIRRWHKVLRVPVTIEYDTVAKCVTIIVLNIDHYKDADEIYKECSAFFRALAGCVSDTLWNKWFASIEYTPWDAE